MDFWKSWTLELEFLEREAQDRFNSSRQFHNLSTLQIQNCSLINIHKSLCKICPGIPGAGNLGIGHKEYLFDLWSLFYKSIDGPDPSRFQPLQPSKPAHQEPLVALLSPASICRLYCVA